MGETDLKKEINELTKLLEEIDNIKVVKNIKLLLQDYIEETKEERAISNF